MKIDQTPRSYNAKISSSYLFKNHQSILLHQNVYPNSTANLTQNL